MILKPVIALMNKMSFFKKFTLIFAIILIPLVISLTFVIITLDERAKSVELQSNGINYDSQVRKLIKHTQEHRGMSSILLNGDASIKNNLAQKDNDILSDIENIDKLEKFYGKGMNTSSHWSSIKESYTAILKNLESMSAKESFDTHTALIRDLFDLTLEINTSTKLLLQDKLEDYYLIDTVVNKLPLIAEYMGQSRAIGSGIATKEAITEEEKEKLNDLVDSINLLMDEANNNLQFVFTDQSMEAELKAETDKFEKATKGLTDKILSEFINTGSINIPSKEYFNYATVSINDVYAFLDKASDILDEYSLKEKNDAISLRTLVLIIAIISALLVFYLALGLYYAIVSNIKHMKQISEKVAKGDLTARINHKANDETGIISDSINALAVAFSQMVSNSKELSDIVESTVTELSSISNETSALTNDISGKIDYTYKATTNQLYNTQEIANVINQVSIGVQEIAGSSAEVAMASKDMEIEVEKGNQSLKTLIEKMESIKSFVDDSSNIIDSLGERSKDIGQIVESIKAITDQTNLLALNAAIEAARAGEHGKGFSVVAEEVRKLAEQSKQSTDKVTVLIKNVQHDTMESVQRMNQIKVEVEDGFEKVVSTGEIFSKISLSTSHVSTQVQDVSATTEEISASAEEITANVTEISNIAENNNDHMNQVADMSKLQLDFMARIVDLNDNLKQQTKNLEAMISKYRI